ncbi:MAG: DUF58 domain-containing protein [Pirellulaceae bacterium]
MKWFVGAGLLLLLAQLMQSDMLAYAMYTLLTLMVVSRLLTQSWIKHLTSSRQCNRLTAEVGETVAIHVTVHNRGKFPIPWVLLEDVLPQRALHQPPAGLQLTGNSLKLAMLRGNQSKTMHYQLECHRRGYFQLGPTVLETGDLFGLHRRYRVGNHPNYLMVYPKIIPLQGFDIASRRPIGEVKMSYRLYEDPTRIAGIRRYEIGDPLNRIHWRASARTGQLHSKIYEPTTVAGVTLLLEFHEHAYDSADEPVRSELAVTAAASIAYAVQQMGQQIGLISNGRDAADRIRQQELGAQASSRRQARDAGSMLDESDRLQPLVIDTRREVEQMLRIRETLARIELSDGLTLEQLTTETASRMPRDATVLAIIPRVDESTAIALGNLKRRGYAVSAILNLYDDMSFAEASASLLSQRIPTYHLKSEESIPGVCQNYLLR